MSAPRKALTKLQFGFLVNEQAGLCGCGCGKPLVFKPQMIRDEHLRQVSSFEPHEVEEANALSNRSLWRLECTKTKDALDAKSRAKVRRLTGQNKPRQSRKIQGRSEIQSRPFQKAKSSGFNRGYLI